MKAAKSDANQPEIVAALRALGATVTSLHRVGAGCPDLLVGYRGCTSVIEVKAAKGRMTPQQVSWHGAWRGSPVVVLRSVEDALAWCAGVKF